MEPDLAGYRDAQERLRRQLGESIILLAPPVRTYDPGVALDPESGDPYDPLVAPTADTQASAVVQGRVAYRGVPRNAEQAVESGALGFMEDSDVVAILSSGVASAASGAVGMVIRDEHYEVRNARFDGIVGTDRYLVFGAKDPR